MRIAVPITGGQLSPHFGHCDEFALIDIDQNTKGITDQRTVEAPPHSPGLLPEWLSNQGVNLVLAGGLGTRALTLFADQGIEVAVGLSGGLPEQLVKDYLAGNLQTGSNICDH